MKALLFLALLMGLISSLNPVCDLCHRLVGVIRKTTPEKPTEFVLDQIAVAYCVK